MTTFFPDERLDENKFAMGLDQLFFNQNRCDNGCAKRSTLQTRAGYERVCQRALQGGTTQQTDISTLSPTVLKGTSNGRT